MSSSPNLLVDDVSHPPAQRLKLKLSTPPHQSQNESMNSNLKEESSSPIRPSYSPVTPTMAHVPMNTTEASQQWIDEPKSLPTNLDENPDAIALRATISLLQMQRQQTLRDIRTLDRTKQEAIGDPEAFVNDLKDGRLKNHNYSHGNLDDDKSEDEDVTDVTPINKFGKLPDAQNIARCPPIEWSKYHIIGEPLDRLHELQKEYPGLTEESLARGISARPHEITAPYRPFLDKIEPHPASTEKLYDR